jgi:D-alanyl-D-alanine carboxypeptidase
MKLLSISIMVASLTAGAVAVRHEAAKPVKPASTAPVEPVIEHPEPLPNRTAVREEAILKKMDDIQHQLSYLKGRTERK